MISIDTDSITIGAKFEEQVLVDVLLLLKASTMAIK
jgi:hypothetical protein